MRYFQTLSGKVVGIYSVTDLDDKTVIGFKPGGGTSIFSKDLEITNEHLKTQNELNQETNKNV